MKKNKLIVIIIIIIIVVIIGVFSYVTLNKKEDNSIIGNIIDEKSYNTSIFENETSSGELEIAEQIKKFEKEELISNEIKSKIRVLCQIGDIKTIVGLNTFKIIKDSIDEIRDEQENKEKFLYIDLPGIVYQACPDSDGTFLDKLLKYLQAEGIGDYEKDKIDIEKYNVFLENIKFKTQGIDNQKIKTDKNYFDKVFFEDNLKPIESSYFSEYISRATDPDTFFNTKSLLSLSETNNILEKTVGNFDSFLKNVGLNGIKEFREYILKNNNYKNKEDLINSIDSNYDNLLKITKKEFNIDLNEQLSTIASTIDFYKNDYEKITKNEEINKLFNSIGKKYLFFSIINSDYADGLDETWSGKEFFGDHVTGNSIIKIGFIYLYNSSKK